MMKSLLKPRIGLVTVASKAESGGQRGAEITVSAKDHLSKLGLEIFTPDFIVWTSEDAQKAIAYLQSHNIDMLLILHCTWVMDSLQFQLVKGLDVPVVLWGLPYPETFSFATVQHFSSILKHNDIFCLCVLGLPEDKCVQEKINRIALSACVAKQFRPINIGLIGPRPTWRIAGPQDMVYDEWDLANELGINVIHIEIDEFIEKIDQVDANAALEIVKSMKAAKKTGILKVEEERILHSAKVYLTAKKMLRDYNMTGMTVECYPYYGGMVNLASSWLADEGIVLDPEGDISHTMLESLLNCFDSVPTALAELMLVDWDSERIFLRHEGSSAASLAVDSSQIEVIPAGEGVGTIVQFPMRSMPVATVASISGKNGNYSLFIGKVAIEELKVDKWRSWGGNFQIAVKPPNGIEPILENVFSKGMDHHWLIKEGDWTLHLEAIGKIWKMKIITITNKQEG